MDKSNEKKIVDGKKEIVYVVGYSLVSKIITYALLLIFANFYLSKEYGLGSFVLNLRNLIMLFALIGVPESIIPLLIRKKNIKDVLWQITRINLFVFLIGLFLVIGNPWILPFVLTYPLVALTSIGSAFWRAESKYSLPSKVGIYSTLIVLILAFLLQDLAKLGIVLAYSIGNLFSFIMICYPIRQKMIKAFQKKREIKTKNFLRSGITIAIISGAFTFFGWLNSTILGLFGDFEGVAQFNVSLAISGVIAIIPTSLSMFILTRAGEIKKPEVLEKVLHRVTRVSFFTSLFFGIILVILSPLIISFFFSKYIGIQEQIMILSIGMIFFSAYYIVYSFYIGKMEIKKAIIPVLSGLAINILTSFLLAPIWGVKGIAISNTLAHGTILFLISYKEKIKRIPLAAFLVVSLIILSYLSKYISIAILILVIPLSVLFKIITKEDMNEVRINFYKLFKKEA